MRSGKWAVLGCSLGLFIFALLSKPTTTPLPILLLLLDYWPLRRLNGKAVVEKIPFLLVGVVSAIVTMISQARTAWVQMPHDNPLPIALIIGHDLVFLSRQILWPVNLSSHYPYPLPFAWSNAFLVGELTAACLLGILLAFSAAGRGRFGGRAFSSSSGCCPRWGSSGLPTFRPQTNIFIFRRWDCSSLAWGLAGLWRWSGQSGRGWCRAGVGVAFLILVGLEIRETRQYVAVWKDSTTLFRHMLRIHPTAFSLYHGMGRALVDEGKITEGIRYLSEAVRLNPESKDLYYGLGYAFAKQGNYIEAVKNYQNALRLKPDYDDAHYNLANLLRRWASTSWRPPITTQPFSGGPSIPSTTTTWGSAWCRRAIPDALAEYEAAIRIKPDYLQAHSNLGDLLVRQGKIEADRTL